MWRAALKGTCAIRVSKTSQRQIRAYAGGPAARGCCGVGCLGDLVMRTSPSIVPHGADEDTYLVLDDFGRLGCAWRETDVESADRNTLIRHLLKGDYNNPLR